MMEKMTALLVSGSIALAGISGLNDNFTKSMEQLNVMFDQTLAIVSTWDGGAPE